MSRYPDEEWAGPAAAERGFARVEEVFFEVAGLSPGDREDGIRRLCEGDPALEREVRSLVAAAGGLGAFLEQPALGKGFDLERESQKAPHDEMIGTVVGAFRIERRIASGGMGTVYEAVRADGQFDQRVAVKIVKRGMDTEDVLRRFKSERQTLAALDHPNIARLIDGGVTGDGRPFLAMEFVAGLAIDQYCDQNRLPVRERLTLLRAVCDAVHHAHQNLIIHRDLKPSNILVTAQGVPKLLDFGIARLLSGGTGAGLTTDAERRLTPEYASPEQVEGTSLTTASDVYSLGVVLYELLTGAHPYTFTARTSEEVRRVVCFQVPPPPSQAVASPGPAPGARTTRPTGNNPKSTTRPLTTDAAGTRRVSSTRLRGQLRGDLDNIVLMALRKEPDRRYASVEQLSADIGRYLDGMPVRARRDTTLYRASKFVRRHAVGVALTAATLVLLSTATVLLHRQARELEAQRDQLADNYAALAAQERVISAKNQSLAASLRFQEENRSFLMSILRGGDIRDQGPDARLGDLLRDAAAMLDADPPQDQYSFAGAQYSIGTAMLSLGMLGEARKLLEGAAAAFDAAALPPDADARVDVEVALAELLFYEGRPTDAETRLRALLDAERERSRGSPTAREGTLLTDIGACLRAQRKAEESIAVQRDALRVRLTVHGEKDLDVAETRNNLASSLFQKGEHAAAIEEFTRSLEVRRELLRPDHPSVLRVEGNLGLAKLKAGDVDGAIALLTHAAEAREKAFGPDHPGNVSAMTSLAMALRQGGRHDEALAWFHRVLDWQSARFPADSPQVQAVRANIGVTLAAQGSDDAAAAALDAALPALRAAGSPFAGITRTATLSLAELCEKRGDADRARELRASVSDRP